MARPPWNLLMKPILPVAACLIGVSLSACAAEVRRTGEDASAAPSAACDRDGSMVTIKACAQADLEREQARMRRYLEAATPRARQRDEDSVKFGPRSRQAAYLVESQRAWQAYADSRCAGVLEETSGGTMGGLGYAWCMTEMTRQRAHDVWSDHLTYADSTPPVLPEPVRTIAEDRVAAGLD
jgi:uncharacterized protein YecT (DUF1311 family)